MHAHDFQRWGPFWGVGVVNCRLEPFRKFIRFGSVTRPLDWYGYFSLLQSVYCFVFCQLLKKTYPVLWNYSFVSVSCSEALFKVPKICNIKFWIENEPPLFRTFPKIHPILYSHSSLISGDKHQTWNFIYLDVPLKEVSSNSRIHCLGGNISQSGCTLHGVATSLLK